jgi:uncharacterized membrane protein
MFCQMRSLNRFFAGSRALVAVLVVAAAPALAQGPVVRAVLFYSPTCPHCHKVIQEDLPGIFEAFGGGASVYFDRALPADEVAFYIVANGQVELLLVNVVRPVGYELFQAATVRFQIGDERSGVPRLVIGDSVLVGSLEIPRDYPRLIEEGLAAGGTDWPDLTGMAAAVASVPGRPLAVAAPESAAVATPESAGAAEPVEAGPSGPAEAGRATGGAQAGREAEAGGAAGLPGGVGPAAGADSAQPGLGPDTSVTVLAEPEATGLETLSIPKATALDLYLQDPVGNGMSVVVLVFMVLSLGVLVAPRILTRLNREPGPAVPFVALVGIVVAAYLSYVESQGVQAVCGPVGDCNTVQQSEYAKLFGVIPVGAVGLVGYVAIIAAWLVARLRAGFADWAKLATLAMTLFGTVFSIYLTFLEPFVIGATCVWCLTSAVATTILMWLSVRPGLEAWTRLRAVRRTAA